MQNFTILSHLIKCTLKNTNSFYIIMDDTSNMQIQRKLREWLAKNFSPACAVLGSEPVLEFMKENANLSPAEFLRPFCEISGVEGKLMATHDK